MIFALSRNHLVPVVIETDMICRKASNTYGRRDEVFDTAAELCLELNLSDPIVDIFYCTHTRGQVRGKGIERQYEIVQIQIDRIKRRLKVTIPAQFLVGIRTRQVEII